MKCAHDGCHSVEPGKGRKYCPQCKCYRKAMAAKQKMPPRQVTCAYDSCCRFETWNRATRYCHECGCDKKARSDYHNERDRKEDFFEQGREFRLLSIKRLEHGTSVLVVGDIHIPFADGPTLKAVERFWDDFKPDIEIYNGDLLDCYSISTFDKNPTRAFDFKDEIDSASSWLRRRVKRNPNARRIFMEGNHEDRLRTWLWKKAPEVARLRGMSIEEQLGLKEMGFTVLNYRSRLDILGVLIEHGYRASRSDTAYPMNVARLMGLSTQSSGVCGHSHGLNTFRWRDARGSHSYREHGCLCRMNLEYAPFPTTWAWGFVYGIVRHNKLYLTTVPIYEDGFEAMGKFYPRNV